MYKTVYLISHKGILANHNSIAVIYVGHFINMF
jgi:hypothetical protein